MLGRRTKHRTDHTNTCSVRRGGESRGNTLTHKRSDLRGAGNTHTHGAVCTNANTCVRCRGCRHNPGQLAFELRRQ